MRIDEMCLHTKYEHCNLNSMEVRGKCLVHRLSFQQTDRQTPLKQYAPDLLMRRHKNLENKAKNVLENTDPGS